MKKKHCYKMADMAKRNMVFKNFLETRYDTDVIFYRSNKPRENVWKIASTSVENIILDEHIMAENVFGCLS